MPRAPTPAERARAERLAAEAEQDARFARRRRLATLAGGAAASAAGLALLALSFALDDAEWAGVAFWGGLAVGNAGLLLVVLLRWREPR